MTLPSNLFGTLQESIMNVFSTWNLWFYHTEILRVRQRLCLHCVRLGGCRYEIWRVLCAVDALRQALVGQPLKKQNVNVNRNQTRSLNDIFEQNHSRCLPGRAPVDHREHKTPLNFCQTAELLHHYPSYILRGEIYFYW